MNNRYGIYDNKVFITTDKEITIRENCDNIEEILIQQNLVETIENEIVKIKENIDYLDERKRNYKSLSIINIIIALLLPIIILILGIIIDFININDIFNGIYDDNAKILLDLNLHGIGLFGLAFVYTSNRCNTLKREKKGKLNQIEYLNNIFSREKNKLKEFEKQNISTKINENQLKLKKVNDKEVLEILKEELNIRYNTGYYEDTIKKYINPEEIFEEKDFLKKTKGQKIK